jgi:hypothetical protein
LGLLCRMRSGGRVHKVIVIRILLCEPVAPILEAGKAVQIHGVLIVIICIHLIPGVLL